MMKLFQQLAQPKGVTEGKHCLLCDYKEGQEIIPALGHNIVIDDYIFPTCMESGLTEGSHCSRYNQIIIKQEIIDSVDHAFFDWADDSFFASLCRYGCGTFKSAQDDLHENIFKITFNTDEGYDKIKNDFLKLFTYSNDLKNPSYFELLDYLGLSNVTNEDIYLRISSFFQNDYR